MDLKKVFKKRETERSYESKNCQYCGGKHGSKITDCPAYGKTCNKCRKKNHFQAVCRQTTGKPRHVHRLEDSESDSDNDDFCFTVKSSHGKQWYSNVKMTCEDSTLDVICQLDSGSTCNIIGLKQYIILVQDGQPMMTPTNKILHLYGGDSHLRPLGKVDISCEVKGMSETLTFYVIETDQKPLLSAEACETLRLLTVNVVNQVSSSMEVLTENELLETYADVFTGLGTFPGEYKIELDPNVKPVQHQPRKVPQALKEEIRQEINRLEKKGIIAKVTTPTEWISSMVAVKKPGKLRICIDPKDLNSAIRRSHYPMPTLSDILPKITNAKVFTVLDAKEGFWQIKLDEESSLLTTFWTPHGRYRWLRMPFGISSAPEEFQRRQHEVLEGLEGAEAIADDILVYGSGESMEDAITDHDKKLCAVLERARQVGLKLNKEKMKFRQSEIKYMGEILTSSGARPDPDKVKAITEMPRPENVKAVQRYVGLVTYLSKFCPHLSETCEPLRRLTVKNAEWSWQSQQEAAFESVKKIVSTEPLLKYYDVNQEVTIQCDSSEVGLGATLLQEGQPVAYASRALSQTEQRYAQIEKECLAIAFACEHFDQYILGKEVVTVHSDHKPLEIIFKKPLLSAPKRLQRMILRLQKYNLNVTYKKGAEMYIADTLSRAALPIAKDSETHCDSKEHIFAMFLEELDQIEHDQWVPQIKEPRIRQIRELTNRDETLQTLKSTILAGWPDVRDEAPANVRPYWNVRDELTVQDGVIYKGNRIVVLKALRAEMLTRIHSSHLGIGSCLRKARDSLYWPNMNDEIKDYIGKCSTCNELNVNQQKEPLMTHDVPNQPWSKLGIDLFALNKKDYLVTVDYFSDYFELDELQSTTASAVILCLKRHFARHGRPDIVVSDNGPQFSSTEFSDFAAEWEFEHSTSSPYHSQSNGKAESAVKIAKSLFKKAIVSKTDIWKALLDWRNTPTVDMQSSPVQRLMSRRTRHSLPMAKSLLQPQVATNVKDKVLIKRQKSKLYHDKAAKELPALEIGQNVRMKPSPSDNSKTWKLGTCVRDLGNRSYDVNVDGVDYRRNRRDLRATKEGTDPSEMILGDQEGPSVTIENELIDTPAESAVNPLSQTQAESNSDQRVNDSNAPVMTHSPVKIRQSNRSNSGKMPARFDDYIV